MKIGRNIYFIDIRDKTAKVASGFIQDIQYRTEITKYDTLTDDMKKYCITDIQGHTILCPEGFVFVSRNRANDKIKKVFPYPLDKEMYIVKNNEIKKVKLTKFQYNFLYQVTVEDGTLLECRKEELYSTTKKCKYKKITQVWNIGDTLYEIPIQINLRIGLRIRKATIISIISRRLLKIKYETNEYSIVPIIKCHRTYMEAKLEYNKQIRHIIKKYRSMLIH